VRRGLPRSEAQALGTQFHGPRPMTYTTTAPTTAGLRSAADGVRPELAEARTAV
jgi:hypothetical protein